MREKEKEKLVLKLFQIGCIQFGSFTLKSGINSPIYIDLRILVSFPQTLKQVGQAFASILKTLKYDRIAAVPYTALPLAGAVSFILNKPWIYTRKEVKKHGLKRPIEGLFKKGERIVVIDDLVTTGVSKLEVIKPIENSGLKIKDIVVLIDREQGGKEQLKTKGYRLHSVINFTELLEVLNSKKKISEKKYNQVISFLKKSKVK